MVTAQGKELDLENGSPAMLKHYLRIAHEEKADKDCDECITQRGTPLNIDEKLDWHMIRKILRKQKLSPKNQVHTVGNLLRNCPDPLVVVGPWVANFAQLLSVWVP